MIVSMTDLGPDPLGWDLWHVTTTLEPGADVVAEQCQICALHVITGDRQHELHLQPSEIRIFLRQHGDGNLVDLYARITHVQIVADAVVEHVDFPRHLPQMAAQTNLEVGGTLLVRIRIAYLQPLRGGVGDQLVLVVLRPAGHGIDIGVELLHRRRALRVRHRDQQIDIFPCTPQAGHAAAETAVGIFTVAHLLQILVLTAYAEFIHHVADIDALQRKQRDGIDVSGGDVGLVAQGAEGLAAILHAGHSHQVADRAMREGKAPLAALVLVHRAHLPVALDLGVLIIHNTQLAIGFLEETAQRGLALEIQALLLHRDANAAFRAVFLWLSCRVILFDMRLMVMMCRRRQAVMGLGAIQRHTQIATIKDPGESAGQCLRACRRIVDEALAGQQLGKRLLVSQVDGVGIDRIATDARVVAGTIGAIEMPSQLACAILEFEDTGLLVRRALVPGFQQPAQRIGHRCRHTVVDDIDHAADRAVAVQQRRRATHHLNALGKRRLQTVGMVRADRRRINIADATLQDLHAIAALTANHRHADTRAKGRAVDAHQLLQGFPQCAGRLLPQGLAAEHIHRQRRFRAVALQCAGDNDFIEHVTAMRLGRLHAARYQTCRHCRRNG